MKPPRSTLRQKRPWAGNPLNKGCWQSICSSTASTRLPRWPRSRRVNCSVGRRPTPGWMTGGGSPGIWPKRRRRRPIYRRRNGHSLPKGPRKGGRIWSPPGGTIRKSRPLKPDSRSAHFPPANPIAARTYAHIIEGYLAGPPPAPLLAAFERSPPGREEIFVVPVVAVPRKRNGDQNRYRCSTRRQRCPRGGPRRPPARHAGRGAEEARPEGQGARLCHL